MLEDGAVARTQTHWWSSRPVTASAPISARRGYLEVLTVFAAFYASGIAAAGLSLGHRLPKVQGSWAVYGPAAIDALAQAGVAAVLVVLLSRNRGVGRQDLGLVVLRSPKGAVAVAQTLRISAWAVAAFIVGSLVTSLLATGQYDRPSYASLAFIVYSTTASLNAGVVEEMVVLGFVLVTLQQARRPLPEIVVVALLLRVSYHLYYGPGAIGILVWAGVFIWLYLRTRSLLPLIIVHFLWDLTVFLTLRWPWIGGIAVLGVIGLIVASPITWLVERGHRHQALIGPGSESGQGSGPAIDPALVPAGWQPDPSGLWRWRWWDGRRWTEDTSA